MEIKSEPLEMQFSLFMLKWNIFFFAWESKQMATLAPTPETNERKEKKSNQSPQKHIIFHM